jgi:hypothetical protein
MTTDGQLDALIERISEHDNISEKDKKPLIHNVLWVQAGISAKNNELIYNVRKSVFKEVLEDYNDYDSKSDFVEWLRDEANDS